MPKTDIKTLAALSEILASIAVIVSLIFVIVSLNQNTAALRSINDNFLYQIQDARMASVSNDAELAAIIVRRHNGEVLDEIDEERFMSWLGRELNLWEVAFARHNEGLMPPDQWAAWDANSSNNILPFILESDWQGFYRPGYNVKFAEHVDAKYAEYEAAQKE